MSLLNGRTKDGQKGIPGEQRRRRKRHIEKKKIQAFLSFITPTLNKHFQTIKPLEPVFVTLHCDISLRHGSPASLPSSLPILPLPASCPHAVSPVSFQPSKMNSLTKACFQPGRGVPTGIFNNSKYPETLTPLLTDLVLLFFSSLDTRSLRRNYLKKKREGITSSPTQADLDQSSESF